MKRKKLAIIYGTRPEIIKFFPIIRLCQEKKIPFLSVHTGQHYSYKLDKIFFEQLKIPSPDYALNIKSIAPYKQGEQTGKMLLELERILLKEYPEIVLVQGDTNTTLAGALTAEKLSTTKDQIGYFIKIGHVEAGLRSYDRSMPEEINRVIVDHLSDFLFAPCKIHKINLLKEHIPKNTIHITGNTIVDTLSKIYDIAKKRYNILSKLKISRNEYILMTLHRQENVDSFFKLKSIIRGVKKVYDEFKIPILFPIHPRTLERLKKFRISIPEGIRCIEPQGFFEFLMLEKHAFFVMTDSGGVQEETCIMQVPCITLRRNTERPETIVVGSNIIGGTSANNILNAAKKIANVKRNWKHPYGDGNTSQKILDIILK